MKLNGSLIMFGSTNVDGKIINQNSYNWNELIRQSDDGLLYGKLGETQNSGVLQFSEISHSIKNVEVRKDGIYAQINILDTVNGKILKLLIENYIPVSFGANLTGHTDTNNNIFIDKIISFDVVIGDKIMNRYKKLNKILNIIRNKNE